jgi:hypothetical protein
VILVLSMRKKKPLQTVSDDETTGQEDPFSDLFRDENDEDDYVAEHQTITPAGPIEDAGEKSTPWMSQQEAQKMLMDADAVIKEAAENNPIAEFEGQVEDDAYGFSVVNEGGIDFDLKKAVIYSEIIERRSF